MEEQVEESVAKDRFNRLLKEVQSSSSENASKLENTVQKALVEEINEQDSNLMTGRLTNNLLVHFRAGRDLIGKIVEVKLTECKGFYYIGELL